MLAAQAGISLPDSVCLARGCWRTTPDGCEQRVHISHGAHVVAGFRDHGLKVVGEGALAHATRQLLEGIVQLGRIRSAAELCLVETGNQRHVLVGFGRLRLRNSVHVAAVKGRTESARALFNR